ncbi:GNAT family N-acetyltransferase [Staphylococcus epidermidis]|uniref:GNAT family N-acetyltransferase n=1 Tax=Staphylococcus epidermidis TaxID=1282 RepID=UPI0010A95044|nr:GNAT family N-acetyltransferase [Staphylococcus epidermidis]MBF2335187.1 GNAT family N-acetyltransferase [Staphylococcus epidermidis]MCG1448956.1 GNAT family N-acetyltransferase [Staphylococcus epidermidis]MCG2291486.1 GNAT family N-acetyltransferase [Staphylococcus epidermidis]MDT0741400.1 GNAT family N-acetyltransferase [Staphylococcus epidermidis]QRS45277.1 GNAT family N-acetyltransferase [Staphylococcus epidermidis]
MIRLATKDDLLSITQLVKEAKQIMEEFNNNQWDDEYPAKEHFEEDIENKTLYVLDVNHTIYGFIVIDQNQSEWYDDIDWPVNRNGAYVIHRLAGSKQYKGAATELFQFAMDLANEHDIHVILTDTFALNKPAQGLFEKFGFTKVDEIEIDYHPFDRGAPFYAYYKNI